MDHPAYMRIWRKLPENIEKVAKWKRNWCARNREHDGELKAKWKKENPEKVKAHSAISNGIQSGAIIRPTVCSKCDRKCKPEAHHPDYTKPLDVIWLCKKCHEDEG